ncbi:MAG: hypothetical protein Kow0047_16430 [Anaerolineae bacterium]
METETRVRCRAETRYPERPTAVRWGERWHEVTVLRQWREPDALLFRVRSVEGDWFLLRYRISAEMWDVTLLAHSNGQNNSGPDGAS